VHVEQATVTAVRTVKAYNYGFFIRQGTAPWQAIFVYTKNDVPASESGTPLQAGDVIDLDGTLTVYNNIDELTSPQGITVTGSALADPVATIAAELSPGSTSAESLESHLVQVTNVEVAKMDDPAQNDHFWVAAPGGSCSATPPDCAKISDFFYDGGIQDGQPAVTVGQSFSSITGVIEGFKDDHTLQPRDASDLVSP
jgi:hypothetical protein